MTDARVTKDLSLAKVFYALLDKDVSVEEVEKAFLKASGFLRSRLAKELSVRRVPELRFEYDDSGLRGDAMDTLIDAAIAKDSELDSDAAKEEG